MLDSFSLIVMKNLKCKINVALTFSDAIFDHITASS